MEAFRQFGIADKNVFADKKSGKDFERKAYRRLLRRLRGGDLLVIKSIDRLGREYGAIIDAWSEITGRIGADILVLDMSLPDTRIKSNSLVGRFISDVVLQVVLCGGKRTRQYPRAAGRRHCARQSCRHSVRSAGARAGRRFYETASAFLAGTITLSEALANTGMTRQNFHYHLHRLPVLKER